jgi:hypothetical protein
LKSFSPFLISLSLIASSCLHKDEKISTEGKLEFSRDTIFFDTIFTSIGSITKRLKVYNRNSSALRISSIELGGYSSSPYELIIDGVKNNSVKDLFIRGGDSLFILIKVTIDPQDLSTPYLVSDSILFNTNGNTQKVQLAAYGQDANFLNSTTIACDTIWTSGKPFVVYNYARIPAGCTLTIRKGVKVLFHENSIFDVKGTLLVEGEKDSIVVFSGDRLSGPYKNLAGQWKGIVFDASSKNNSFVFSLIKNAVTGLTVHNDPADADTIPEIFLKNTIVQNMQQYGVISYGMDSYAENCLFTNAVRNVFAGVGGGEYHFIHCTFSNYSYSFFREGSAVRFSNYYSDFSGTVSGLLKTRFTNCILWGDRSEELDLINNISYGFDFVSFYSLLKTMRTDQNINNNIINSDPLFVKPVEFNFRLKAGSPVIDAGQATSILQDIEGEPRDSSPDPGAFEYFP